MVLGSSEGGEEQGREAEDPVLPHLRGPQGRAQYAPLA